MRPNKTMILTGSACITGAMGLLQHSFDLLFVSGVLATFALVSRLPLSALWSRAAATRDGRIDQLEESLRLTEDELDSATRQLAELREQHEFDARLLKLRSHAADDASEQRGLT